MAEVDNSKSPSLSEQYLLKEKEEKSTTVANPVEETEVKASSTAPSEEDTPKTEETPVVESSEAVPATSEESSGASDSTTPEINEASPPVEAESENRDETPEIKLETAPADFRFPTTNQTRHCFTRYVEYHRCIAAKGEGAPECDKFAKYYRSLCPGEWLLLVFPFDDNMLCLSRGCRLIDGTSRGRMAPFQDHCKLHILVPTLMHLNSQMKREFYVNKL